MKGIVQSEIKSFGTRTFFSFDMVIITKVCAWKLFI